MFTIDSNSKTPPYLQIMEQFRRTVNQGRLSPDDPLPSVRAIANEQNLSVTTVQKAFHLLQREGVIYSKAGKGNFVKKDDNGVSQTIHLFLPKFTLSFYGLILQGVHEEMKRLDYSIVLHSLETDKLDWDATTIDGLEQAARNKSPVIFIGEAFGEMKKVCLDTTGMVPFVSLEWCLPGASSVVNDYEFSIFSYISQNIPENAKGILVLKGHDYQYNMMERMKGFRCAAREKKWENEIQIFYRESAFDAQSAYDVTLEFLGKEKPEWIICANDYEAIGAVGAVIEKGFLPGKDIRVIGYGDMIDKTTSFFPLTTISQNLPEMGKQAVLAVDRLRRGRTPEQLMVKTELIERKT